MPFQGQRRGGEHVFSWIFIAIREKASKFFTIYWVYISVSFIPKCKKRTNEITTLYEKGSWYEIEKKFKNFLHLYNVTTTEIWFA